MTSLQKKLIHIRRHIHKYPELGNQEFRTSEYITSILNSAGIKTKKINKTGVVGILAPYPGAESGRTIALRADIDALPVEEQTGKSYSSCRKGIMHACGHDANTTIVLGAALLLKKIEKEINGCVKFIFQPNEESAGGASEMIKSGVLRNPDVKAIVGIHVNSELPAGSLGIKYGEMMASVDKFTVEIFGGGGHAAYPHKGKDTILVASEIVRSLQTLVSRKIDPTEPVVISVGSINGGTRFNVLPEKVTLTGTVRTLNEGLHKQMPGLIKNFIYGIIRMHYLKLKMQYEVLGCPLRNDKKILDICARAGEKVVGKSKIKFIDKPSMGGEDFAEYLRSVPGCFLYIGSKRAGRRNEFSWHHPKFDIDERCLETGAEILKQVVVEYSGLV
ncbi:MAG: hypothetical protein AUJ85_10360 [Elusimicrobia bacterium CG1_02_37_114]|nr:MAG: hypothetical protein AUJ85_10360 [Elusimicrobia bacterium CG1_02_37_114]PIV53442.1 MAG: amidohydrolase [Elusimicrobia bacterium CG02_land_8_20_14_3_00_37_13]PIZ12874.1 MAG: amidohydrolase [Elusimicrobia bacterium CG_4_10_14_0_8_um_filter_37_32]